VATVAGRTAIVSGGASGIGAALVRALTAAGACVAILDRDEQRGLAVARELGDSVDFHLVDVADEAEVSAALDRVIERRGGIHLNANLAGITHAARTLSRNGPFDYNAWKRVIDVNLSGTFNVVRLCAERMAANATNADQESRGVIVNTASAAAFEGQVGQAAYAASKGGVVAMTLPLARDLARVAIRVNAIAPGLISTPLVHGGSDDLSPEVAAFWEPMLQAIPHPRRFGRPEEVAGLIMHIFENEYINGECLRIGGGLRMPAQ